MDPTAPPLCDGVSFVVCNDAVYAYGGAVPETIWRLHLSTGTWSEMTCNGAVPPARQNHTAVIYAGHLLLCGGEPMLQSPQPKLMPYYELKLDTFTWLFIDTFGDVPLNRSHHTCTVVGDSAILLGGKPVLSESDNDGGGITNARMSEYDRAGFYDVYILDIVPRVWRSVAARGPSPQLWGHSAAAYDDAYVVLFGGLDVSQRYTAAISRHGSPHHPHDPPVAAVSNKLFLLDVHAAAWRVVPPASGSETPPRALHAAHVDGAKMYVLGGFNVDKHGGVVLLQRGLWVYDVLNGTWSVMDFPEKLPVAVRRLSCIYESQLVVAATMESLWCIDLHEEARTRVWQEIPTSQVKFVVEPAANGPDEYNEIINPRHCSHYYRANSDGGDKEEESKQPSSFNVLQKVARKEVDTILDEIHQLRELVLSKRNLNPSPLPPKAVTEGSHSLSPPQGPVRLKQEETEIATAFKTVAAEDEDKRNMKKLRERKKKRERVQQLTKRLAQLMALEAEREGEEAARLSAIQQMELQNSSHGEVGRHSIKASVEHIRQDAALGHCNSFLNVASPLYHDQQQHRQAEGEEGRLSPSVEQRDNSDRWSRVLDVMKRSPSRPSKRAFRASIVTL